MPAIKKSKNANIFSHQMFWYTKIEYWISRHKASDTQQHANQNTFGKCSGTLKFKPKPKHFFQVL